MEFNILESLHVEITLDCCVCRVSKMVVSIELSRCLRVIFSFTNLIDIVICIFHVNTRLVLPVVWCCYLPFYVMSFSIPIMVSAFLYGDKLFLSRLCHDIPNLIMTVTYIILIEFSPITGLSAIQSAMLIFYYMSRLIVRAIQDVLTKQPDTAHYISNAFGELTIQKALYFSFIQPMLTLLLSPIWSAWLTTPIWILRKFDGWNGIQIEDWTLWSIDDDLNEEAMLVEEAIATVQQEKRHGSSQEGNEGQDGIVLPFETDATHAFDGLQQKPNAFESTLQKTGTGRGTVVPNA